MVITGPPLLVLLPSNASSQPSWQEAGASLLSSNRTLYLEYSKPSPLSLAPCASLLVANGSSITSCAAAAFDSLSGSDLCALITVVDISVVPNQAK